MPSVNLDITHRCTLECLRCSRSAYKERGLRVPGRDMTIDEYKKVISYFDYINFCGNVSDPVFNPNFIEFLKMNYENGIGCHVSNAATGKSLSWYEKAFAANPKAKWIFGLDGLPEKSHLYRKNQNGPALFEAMKLCREMGLDTVWSHIIFRFNENDLDECQKLADKYNIEINFIKSSRFLKEDDIKPLDPNNYIQRDYSVTSRPKVPQQ